MTLRQLLAVLDAGVRAYATRYAVSVNAGKGDGYFYMISAMRDETAKLIAREEREQAARRADPTAGDL
jgi:hypothetical protein